MVDKVRSTRSYTSKKNQGKVHKTMSKAERERMKHEHLNKLFFALANALEMSEQNNGILGEATRMVKDTLEQIECLKRENATLLFESQYVSSEKNEVQDENYSGSARPDRKTAKRAQRENASVKPRPESKELDTMHGGVASHSPHCGACLHRSNCQLGLLLHVFVIPPDVQVYRSGA